MQTENVRKRAETDGQYESSNEPLNVAVYKIKDKANKNAKMFAEKDLVEVFTNNIYRKQREITGRLNLDPGNYVIIPSTFDKDVALKFYLRLYIEGEADTEISLDVKALNRGKKPKQPNPGPSKPDPKPSIPKPALPKPEPEVEPEPEPEPEPEEEEEELDYEDDAQYFDEYEITEGAEEEEPQPEEEEEEEEPELPPPPRRKFHKSDINKIMDVSGEVVSRACSVM